MPYRYLPEESMNPVISGLMRGFNLASQIKQQSQEHEEQRIRAAHEKRLQSAEDVQTELKLRAQGGTPVGPNGMSPALTQVTQGLQGPSGNAPGAPTGAVTPQMSALTQSLGIPDGSTPPTQSGGGGTLPIGGQTESIPRPVNPSQVITAPNGKKFNLPTQQEQDSQAAEQQAALEKQKNEAAFEQYKRKFDYEATNSSPTPTVHYEKDGDGNVTPITFDPKTGTSTAGKPMKVGKADEPKDPKATLTTDDHGNMSYVALGQDGKPVITPVPGVKGKSRESMRIQIGGGVGSATDPLTPDDYKRIGTEAAITGLFPPLGNGQGDAKKKILHAMQEFSRNSGLTPQDLARAKAGYKGDTKSLGALQTQRDQIVSFEQTASKNLDLFINAASKIVDTGSPLLNRPLRAINEQLLGSEDQSAVNAARQVANNEIAKVTSGGGLGGVLSDSARKEVGDYNPKSATFKQTLKIAKILRSDMANRHESLDNTLGVIRDRIGNIGGPNTSAGGTGPATGGGSITVVDPKGKPHIFPNQQAADNFKAAAGIR